MEPEQPRAAGGAQPPETGPPPATTQRTTTRGTRIMIRILLVVATLLTIVGILAIWANRQVLDPNNWANTSTKLLQNTAIRTQVSDYLVDQVYTNVNVAGQLEQALPPRLQPLAGPAAGGLKNLAQKAAFDLLGRPRVQEAWRTAQRLTAQEFINVVENKSRLVTLQGNAVFVDLRPILGTLSQQLGLPASITQSLPPTAGRLKVVSSNQISTVQNVVKLVRGLAVILPLVALLLYALCVYPYRGRRRHALFFVGIDLVIAGLVVLVARNIARSQVVDSLASTEAVKPAVRAVLTIGTELLSEIAQSTIIIGLAVMLAASLAGERRLAVAIRRAAAPWLRERPHVAYGFVVAVLLLIVAWGPIPATRMPIPVLIMIVLVCLGVEVIRRQTAVEFPDAQFGHTLDGVSRRISHWRSGRHHRGTPPPPAAPIAGGAGPPVVFSSDDRLSLLERLAALRTSGALSDEEFALEKAAILSPNER